MSRKPKCKQPEPAQTQLRWRWWDCRVTCLVTAGKMIQFVGFMMPLGCVPFSFPLTVRCDSEIPRRQLPFSILYRHISGQMLKLDSINLHLFLCNKSNAFYHHRKTELQLRYFLKYLVPESLPVQGHNDHRRVRQEALVVEGQVFPLPRHIQHVPVEEPGTKSYSRVG